MTTELKNNGFDENDHDSEVLLPESLAEVDGGDTGSDDEVAAHVKPYDPSKIRIDTKPTTMYTLIQRLRNDEIDLSPSFQRKSGIWKDITQSRLIESLLIKIPLPAFYMDATEENKWVIIDGLQRLTTIRRFIIDKVLRLTGLEYLTELNGKGYDELDRTFKRRIDEADIVIFKVQPGTPKEVKFDIFRRINTGGMPLTLQEIRHALNQGPIIEFLKQLAESESFVEATANGLKDKRMEDRECVLRWLAFREFPPEQYYTDGDFDRFLNDKMEKFNRYTDEQLGELEDIFEDTMQTAILLFGKDAFRKRYARESGRHPLNKALFEAWAVNLSTLSEDERRPLIERSANLQDRFMRLMQDRTFEAAVSYGTGSIERVRLRFRSIDRLIRETLND